MEKMVNAEFFDALEQLEKEKGIPVDYMLDRVGQALITAYKRDNDGMTDNVYVEPNREEKTIRMYVRKTVVRTEDLYEPYEEITLEEAADYKVNPQVGDIIDIDIPTKSFGRIAAQTAKQVIIQGIREAERGMVISEFESKEHEILNATVARIDPRSGSAYLDVVSGGELYTALAAGFPAEKIYFHGNNKTRDEIVYAIKSGVGRLVVDNSAEIAEIDEVSRELGVNTKILFRIKPGIDAHTHNFIMTGQIDSKFGVALETGEAKALVEDALNHKNITLVGVHCHIGSQIFELDPFRQAAKVMINFMADMKDAFGVTLTELNLGGGFGIKYTQADTPVPFEAFIQAVHEQVEKTAGERGVDVPFILMEPGRSIVGPSGITLYTVGGKKVIPGVRTYVSVDGGMCDNPRYILYASEYEGAVANRAGDEKTEVVTVAGRCCESGDILMQDAKLQPAQKGDILAVFATGAYNYSMASNYNRLPKPAVVMVKDKKARLVVRRETYEDLVKNDI